MVRNVLESSFKSAYLNVILQISSRFLTFGLNTFLIRTIGKDILGIINVRLLLLESTILFLSREPINRAVLSASAYNKTRCSWSQLVNQVWLTVPACVIIGFVSVYIWLKILSPIQDDLYEQYHFSCWAIALSCIIILCAEVPLFVCQVHCLIKTKVLMDTLLILSRSIIFIGLVLKNEKQSVMAFGIAQISAAGLFSAAYYIYFYIYIKRSKFVRKIHSTLAKDESISTEFPFHSIGDMLPGVLKKQGPVFNQELQVLTLSFVKQSVLKQILTEGEKYVMSISPVLTFSEQAVYDTVNNLGSLAVRFIFRPVEDSSYFYFTQTIARDSELEKQNKEKVSEAGCVLTALCRTVSMIGYMAIIFVQSYARIVLLLYCGQNFIADGLAEYLLRYHSLAIYFIALNGVTEAYVFATNTSDEINKYNYVMGIYSFLFLILSYGFTLVFGPVGFILANCINMLLRVINSSIFILKKFKPVDMNPLKGLLPGYMSLTALVASSIICKMSEIAFSECCIVLHVLIGCMCVLTCVLSWYLENKSLLKTLLDKCNVKVKTT